MKTSESFAQDSIHISNTECMELIQNKTNNDLLLVHHTFHPDSYNDGYALNHIFLKVKKTDKIYDICIPASEFTSASPHVTYIAFRSLNCHLAGI